MKKLRNICLLTGVIVLGFGLLARIIPGITITEFLWGFCVGMSSMLFVAGTGFAFAPVFCKKNKKGEQAAATQEEGHTK